MSRTLVPALDHTTDADLCNKRNVSDQRKISVSGCEDSQRRIHVPVSTGIELLPIGECPHVVNCDSV